MFYSMKVPTYCLELPWLFLRYKSGVLSFVAVGLYRWCIDINKYRRFFKLVYIGQVICVILKMVLLLLYMLEVTIVFLIG